MDKIAFEDLLGKHLSVAEEFIGNDFENNLSKKSFYYISDEFIKKDFFGMPYNCVSIRANEKDIVQSITIHFRSVLTRKLYDSFIENYGEPDNIQVIENRKLESETFGEKGSFFEHLTKHTFDLREGSFEENPLYIIWEKEHFQVKAFLRHKQNISEITFSLQLDN